MELLCTAAAASCLIIVVDKERVDVNKVDCVKYLIIRLIVGVNIGTSYIAYTSTGLTANERQYVT